MEFYWYITYYFAFCIVALYLIDVYLLELIPFMVTLYMVVDTSYVYFKSIFISIMTISIQPVGYFYQCIEIMMELNDCDCMSHYQLICGYGLSFIRVLISYLSIASSELIFYDINQWIKQYFINLNYTFDPFQAENGKQCQSYRNMHCTCIN